MNSETNLLKGLKMIYFRFITMKRRQKHQNQMNNLRSKMKKIDTTNMPDLESGKSASERNIINKSRIKNTKINCNQRESKKNKE